MRLINTATIQLHEFFDNEIPFYAILSHRWEGAEVTLEDMRNGDAPKMNGYKKILGCCTQAREDGFQFAWIDSCCINKSSSAELSEAINSMFRWYRAAQVCYVYLSDVSLIKDVNHSHSNSEFRQSKWFTRGWTLQELLAPEVVVFYDNDWIQIGTKASMQSLISSITRIDEVFLASAFRVGKASVAQKMSWAAKRETTRTEDVAYSLMGLLDVNMPLLYGEGKRAFYRLQLEIINNSPDESIFAWGNPSVGTAPDISTSKFYGLLAEDPNVFENCGDIIMPTHPMSAPYVMTNRGLQIEARRVRRRSTESKTSESNGSLKWILSLHCHRRGESKGVAIYLAGTPSLTVPWRRLSDHSFSFDWYKEPKTVRCVGWNSSESDAGHIFIRMAQIQSLSPKVPLAYVIDARSAMKHGYSLHSQVSDAHGMRLLREDNPVIELEGFCVEKVSNKHTILCKCSRGHFFLQGLYSSSAAQRVLLEIVLEPGQQNLLVDNRTVLPHGDVASVFVKRGMKSGQPVNVIELLIERRFQLTISP